jgi:hypothetical protein
VQLKVTPRERLEADTLGGTQIALTCQIRPPGCQRPDELHARQASQLIARLAKLKSGP